MSSVIDTHKYDELLRMEQPNYRRHARMSMEDRGAQFSPFAALTGYEAVIAETGRLTDADTDLTDTGIAILDEKLRMLAERLPEEPWVQLTYFRPDSRKDGGSYCTCTGQVKKMDPIAGTLMLTDQTVLPFSSLKEIEIL